MFFGDTYMGSFELSILIKLLLAALAGGLVGLEREKHGRPAGMRTNLLVSVGACTIMILSEAFYLKYGMIGGDTTLRLDPSRRSAVGENDIDVRLTNLEFRLLHLLMSRPGYVFKSEDIIQTVWGSQRENDQSLLKNMIYRLRKKLEEEAGETNLIQTWPGGYSFQED